MALNTWWENPVEIYIQPKNDLDKRIRSLENQIATLYGLEWSRLPQLIKFLSEKWREQLKEELKKELSRWETLVNSTVNYDVLADKFEELLTLKEELKKQTRAWIDSLSNELAKLEWDEKLTNPKLVSKLLPQNLIERAENPQNFWDNVIWGLVWITETIAVTWKFVWETAFWILKSPYDLYQIATWKAEYDWSRKV